MNGFSILGFPPTFSPIFFAPATASPAAAPGPLASSTALASSALSPSEMPVRNVGVFTWGFHGDFRGCFNGDLSDKWIYNGSLTIYNDNSSR